MTTAIDMAAAAWLVSLGNYLEDGFYGRPGLLLISAAIAVCASTLHVQRRAWARSGPPRLGFGVPWGALLAQTWLLVHSAAGAPTIQVGIALVGALTLVQSLDLKRWRVPAFAATALLFAVVASMASITRDPQIDVFTFQQTAANALEHGADPYAVRIHNLYTPTTQNYGPGVVDLQTNTLTYGLPYPPFSLLLVLPAHAIGGDIRYADVAAIAIAAALIVLSRPTRWTGLVASAFLLTPEVFFLISSAWTEALMVFTFSVVMSAALRWRAVLPYALLGAFFATKQSSILAVPLVWLLLDEPVCLRAYLAMMAKAAFVALLLTVPFFIWNPDGFWRSVVMWQFIQPAADRCAQPPRLDAQPSPALRHRALDAVCAAPAGDGVRALEGGAIAGGICGRDDARLSDVRRVQQAGVLQLLLLHGGDGVVGRGVGREGVIRASPDASRYPRLVSPIRDALRPADSRGTAAARRRERSDRRRRRARSQ